MSCVLSRVPRVDCAIAVAVVAVSAVVNVSQLAEKAQLSARDWKCLMMSQFELGKHAEVKATWIISTEVSSQARFVALSPVR